MDWLTDSVRCVRYQSRDNPGCTNMKMAHRSKEQVCSLLFAGIAGSNPAEGMDVRLLCLLCR